jgi:hypothetical protein
MRLLWCLRLLAVVDAMASGRGLEATPSMGAGACGEQQELAGPDHSHRGLEHEEWRRVLRPSGYC